MKMNISENLVSLSYTSEDTGNSNYTDLSKMMAVALVNNKKNNVTGVVFYDFGLFGQVLEGDRQDVEHTWEKIKKDTRHHKINLLGIKKIQQRQYPDWAMKMFDTAEFKKTFPQFTELLVSMNNPSDKNYRSIKSLWDSFS
jgi:hypothetical protein